MKLSRDGLPLSTAAAKAGMDEKTARKYRSAGLLPSELKKPRDWRTRPDAFAEVWPEMEAGGSGRGGDSMVQKQKSSSRRFIILEWVGSRTLPR